MRNIETRLLISNNDLEFFKQACEPIKIEILSIEPHSHLKTDNNVMVRHQLDQDLYYLGAMVELKRHKKMLQDAVYP